MVSVMSLYASFSVFLGHDACTQGGALLTRSRSPPWLQLLVKINSDTFQPLGDGGRNTVPRPSCGGVDGKEVPSLSCVQPSLNLVQSIQEMIGNGGSAEAKWGRIAEDTKRSLWIGPVRLAPAR